MKKSLIIANLLLTGFIACKNEDTASENDIDAARNFIQSALNDDFDKAQTYMVHDSANTSMLAQVERLSERLTKEEKQKYREASIRIYERRPQSDSSSIIVYSNSYKNKKDSLRVVKQNNEWLVDFNYMFRTATDSLP